MNVSIETLRKIKCQVCRGKKYNIVEYGHGMRDVGGKCRACKGSGLHPVVAALLGKRKQKDKQPADVYLKFSHADGPAPNRATEYIGPFQDDGAARLHRSNYGPVMSVVIRKKTKPRDLMSPGAHRKYVESRA